MAEKRLIDADAFIEALENADADVCEEYPDYYCDWGFSRKAIEDLMQNIHIIDAVEVVRCNNCKLAVPYERTDGLTGYYCMCDKNSFTYGQNWDRRFNPVKESNDFCSYGERRTDG